MPTSKVEKPAPSWSVATGKPVHKSPLDSIGLTAQLVLPQRQLFQGSKVSQVRRDGT